MNIKEFLKDFNGNNKVYIKDCLDLNNEHIFPTTTEIAIRDYEYYTVRNWSIVDDAIYIVIQSQF